MSKRKILVTELLLIGVVIVLALVMSLDYLNRRNDPQQPSSPSQSDEQKESAKNDWIIKETKRCQDAGLRANAVYNGWTYSVKKIVCMPENK